MGSNLSEKIKDFYVKKDKQGKLNKQTICWQFILFCNQYQPKLKNFEGTPFIFYYYDQLKKQNDKVGQAEFIDKYYRLLTAKSSQLQELFFNSVNISGKKVIVQSQFISFMLSSWECCVLKLINKLQNICGKNSQLAPNFNTQKIEKSINLLLLLIEEQKAQVAAKALQQFKIICTSGQLNKANFLRWCQDRKKISVNCSLQGQKYQSTVPLRFVQIEQ